MIHTDADILGEEVPTVVCGMAFWVNEWIVVNRVGLNFYLLGQGVQAFDNRSKKLWQTAQRVPILNWSLEMAVPLLRCIAH